jgi:hypothetical protein
MVEPTHRTTGSVGHGNPDVGHHTKQAFVTEWVLLVGKSLNIMGQEHGSRRDCGWHR